MDRGINGFCYILLTVTPGIGVVCSVLTGRDYRPRCPLEPRLKITDEKNLLLCGLDLIMIFEAEQ